MTCDERRDAIFLAAAGVLEEPERAELETHLSGGCARCAEARAQAETELAALVLTRGGVTPPSRVRERLLARLHAEGAPAAEAPRAQADAPRAPARGRTALAAGLAACLAGAAALGAGWWQVVRPLEQERDRLAGEKLALELAHEQVLAELAEVRGELETQDEDLSQLEARVGESLEQVSLLSARKLDAVDLAPKERGSPAWARVFWDEDYRCFFRAHGLPTLAPGEQYVLWAFSTGDEVQRVGVLEPDADGAATLFTKLPRDFRPVLRTAVTREPAEPGPEPTGPVVLAGGTSR